MRFDRRLTAFCCAALVALLASARGYRAEAAETSSMCDAASAGSLADRPFAKTNPCTVPKHRALIEAGYFQNASAVGGTQLAAYPLGHVRVGLSNRVEAFVDPGSAYAKNGLNGKGVYGWARTGAGVKWNVVRNRRSAVSLAVDDVPQLDETAPISTVPQFSASVASRTALHSRDALSASLGMLRYNFSGVAHSNASAVFGRLVYDRALSASTRAIVVIANQSNIARSSHGQTRGGLAIQRNCNSRLSLDADIGSAFNATASSKAHYLGGGVAYRL